jgi:site-specific recombinase XerC
VEKWAQNGHATGAAKIKIPVAEVMKKVLLPTGPKGPAVKVTVSEEKVKHGEYWQYRVEIRDAGKRVRRYFDTKAKAEGFAREMRDQQKTAGEYWAELAPLEWDAIIRIVSEVKDAGLTLRRVWDAYRTGGVKETLPAITLKDAIKGCVQEREALNCKKRYTRNLRLFLTQFAQGRELQQMAQITKAVIVGWFAARNSFSLETLKGEKTKLSALFSYCVREGYLAANPVEEIELRKDDEKLPEILSVKESARLLVATRRREPALLVYVALALLAGIRPEELERVRFKDIDLARKRVRVTGKTRSERYAPIPDNCIEWLRLARWAEDGELIAPSNATICRARARTFCPVLGREWIQDGSRHTAASYRAAIVKDLGKVAFEFGTSEKMLRKHYLHPVTEEEAVKFFALSPGKRTIRGLKVARARRVTMVRIVTSLLLEGTLSEAQPEPLKEAA